MLYYIVLQQYAQTINASKKAKRMKKKNGNSFFFDMNKKSRHMACFFLID